MDPQLSWYLALSAILFTIGVVGVIIKRNVISMFMCIELMLNAVTYLRRLFQLLQGCIGAALRLYRDDGGGGRGGGRTRNHHRNLSQPRIPGCGRGEYSQVIDRALRKDLCRKTIS